VRLELRLDRSEEVQSKLEAAGIDVIEYDSRRSRYRIRIGKNDVKKHESLLRELMKVAYDEVNE